MSITKGDVLTKEQVQAVIDTCENAEDLEACLRRFVQDEATYRKKSIDLSNFMNVMRREMAAQTGRMHGLENKIKGLEATIEALAKENAGVLAENI